MPEVTRMSVIACHGAPQALDALAAVDAAHVCRVAPDETMLVCDPEAAGLVLGHASGVVVAADPDAVVLDVSDGWTAWTLAGDIARDAFARLSAILLPDEGFAQGDVARVPVKVIALPDRLHLLVPAMWGDYLHEALTGGPE